jgi:peptide/nickel transport system permease protein
MTTSRTADILAYLRRNPRLAVGLVILTGILLFSGIGSLTVNAKLARPLSAPPFKPPSLQYPFGTDKFGRNMLAAMIVGTPLTLQVGLIAGVLGVSIATVLAFASAYYGGWFDTVIRWVVDVGLTIPSIMLLIMIAIVVRDITITQMALVVASTAWLWPTRTMRSQVLSLKERGYVELARLSGMSGLEIILKELMPNLIPIIVANLVSTIASAILATIGLEALGLGPSEIPTLGRIIYWVIIYSGVLQGYWWWWVPPIVIIVLIFLGLFLASTGLDEIANPRLRRVA